MKLPLSLTTVTPLSKFLALFLFLTLPLVGFKLGMDYENLINPSIQNVIQLKPQVTPSPQFDTSDWKTYRNTEYGFETKYYFDSGPTEFFSPESPNGSPELKRIDFGTNPRKFTYGYELTLSKQKPLDDFRSEIISDTVQKIDSSETVELNGNTWTIFNYQMFLTTEYVPYSTAIINHSGYSYSVTTSTLDIKKILSTFRFLDETESVSTASSNQKSCEEFGGKWLADYNECEGLNTFQCKDAGGTFNECASNCRHDPDYPNVYCIQLCIPVCTF